MAAALLQLALTLQSYTTEGVRLVKGKVPVLIPLTTLVQLVSGINTGTFPLTNLTPSVVYDWRVSANCSSAAATNYTVAQFTTSSHNNTIDNIRAGIGIKISPNPVYGNPIIDYIVPENGTVTILVFDTYGQRVKMLYNTSQNSGQYQLTITNQLSNLSSGFYFLWIQQNDKSNFTKFLKQ